MYPKKATIIQNEDGNPYPYNVQVLVCVNEHWFYGGWGRFCKTLDEAKAWIKQNGLEEA